MRKTITELLRMKYRNLIDTSKTGRGTEKKYTEANILVENITERI